MYSEEFVFGYNAHVFVGIMKEAVYNIVKQLGLMCAVHTRANALTIFPSHACNFNKFLRV